VSDRPRDIFDPFDHGSDEVPNLLRPEDVSMLSPDAAHMLAVGSASLVEPEDATVVDPDDAQVVDPDDARVVVADRADEHTDPAEFAGSETLVLIGAPGSGKSTVGPLVAQHLGLPFCDVDALIEHRAGKPIREIFADDGEPAFRHLEEETTLEMVRLPQVVSLGGGAVMSPRVRAALTGHPVVWLEVQAATAIKRAGLNAARPLLVGNVRGTLMKLLAERTPVYQALATITVGNDGDDPSETAATVVARLAELHRPRRAAEG